MAKSTELAKTRVVTEDGVITATVLDRVSADRVARMLFMGSYASLYGGVTDQTSTVNRDIKDLVVFPFSEL